jgi:hypothetical protein
MRIFRYVPGSIGVYLVVAACSAARTGSITSSVDGGGHGDGSSSGGDGPSLLDALTDPVPPASADSNQSGSRRKVKYYAGDDGSKAFAGFYDSQRKEDCSFALAGDGKTRCLPSPTATLSGYYADAHCTQPLLAINSNCATPTYAWTMDSTACAATAGHHVLAVGSPFAGSSVYILGGTACSGPAPTGAGYLYFFAGDEVDPSAFVAATVDISP